MAGDKDPILDNYDVDAEAHIHAIINGEIPYVPEEDEGDDVSSYLNLEGEGEGQGDEEGMDIVETFSRGQTTNDDLELQATTSGEVYTEPLVIQIY
jgi:hypothetical protein